MIDGVDYSFTRPDPRCLVEHGAQFAVRYIGAGSSAKLLDAAELRELRAAGLSVAFCYQEGKAWILKGDHAGRLAARRCLDHLAALGVTAPVPVYHALDIDPAALNRREWGRLRSYLDGVAEVMGRARVGLYGGYHAVHTAQMKGWAPWAWQTYAWSGGTWHKGAQLRQVRNDVDLCGGKVDLCQATTPAYGQWPDPKTGEDDMDVRMLLSDGTRLVCTDWTDTTVYDPDGAAGGLLRYLWGDGAAPVDVDPAVIDELLAGSGVVEVPF